MNCAPSTGALLQIVEPEGGQWRVLPFDRLKPGSHLCDKHKHKHKAIPPFFFVYCRMRFLILGRSVGKGKKKTKIKLEKESGARRPGTSA